MGAGLMCRRTVCWAAAAGVLALSGCGGYVDRYEEGVADSEPIYCYSTLADPTCHRVPVAFEERRLVNYFGPHPSRYPPPPPRPAAKLAPPPEVPLSVRDPEPAIRPGPERPAAAGADGDGARPLLLEVGPPQAIPEPAYGPPPARG
jgi:hypothetical protein